MMNSGNNVPELPRGEDLERDRLAAELSPYWLDAQRNYPEPRYLLQYNGVGFSPLGGIQAISGQKKNGKTFVMVELMAAILGYGSERVAAYLDGLSVNEDTLKTIAGETKVLYVDTEMEQLNSAKVLRRVHYLCGWPQTENNARFRVMWLRSLESDDKQKAHEKRYTLIRQAIEWMRPTAVFVDGVRDIIGDFNDNAESSTLVTELMAIATKYNCCIWNVLHANPRMQNDDESKMRGHLGTELGNKVSDTFVSVKKKDPLTGRVTFTVKQQDARGKDVDDWMFEIVDDAGKGLGIPRLMGRVSQNSPSDAQKRADLAAKLKMCGFTHLGLRYGEITQKLAENLKMGNRGIKKLIDDAKDEGLLIHDATRKRYYLMALESDHTPAAEENELPFEPKDDDEEPEF